MPQAGDRRDAAHVVLARPAEGFFGHFLIDDEVLFSAGITDFAQYAVDPGRSTCCPICSSPSRSWQESRASHQAAGGGSDCPQRRQ